MHIVPGRLLDTIVQSQRSDGPKNVTSTILGLVDESLRALRVRKDIFDIRQPHVGHRLESLRPTLAIGAGIMKEDDLRTT